MSREPTALELLWWPQFERDFEAYVRLGAQREQTGIPVALHDPRPGRPRARLVSERAAAAAVWASNSAS